MIDEKVVSDLISAREKALDIKLLLDRLYYHPEFGTIRTLPIISMLITGAQYIADNLEVLARTYREKVSANKT